MPAVRVLGLSTELTTLRWEGVSRAPFRWSCKVVTQVKLKSRNLVIAFTSIQLACREPVNGDAVWPRGEVVDSANERGGCRRGGALRRPWRRQGSLRRADRRGGRHGLLRD